MQLRFAVVDWQTPPPDATPLEILADDAGMSTSEFREWLRLEVERRRLAPHAPQLRPSNHPNQPEPSGIERN